MSRLRLVDSSMVMLADKSVPTILRIGAYVAPGHMVYTCHIRSNRLTHADVGFGCSKADAVIDFFGKMGAV